MFFDRFVLLCKQKGVTQTKVVDDIGVTRGAIHKWRQGGTPRGKVLSAIADYFGVTTDYLLGNEKSTPADEGQSAELSEDDKRMQRLNSKIALLSDSKRAVLEELLDAMLEK